MNRLRSTASFVRRNYERVAARFESGVSMLERRYTPLGRFTPGPFEGWRFLWQPALLGFVAMSFILAIIGYAGYRWLTRGERGSRIDALTTIAGSEA